MKEQINMKNYQLQINIFEENDANIKTSFSNDNTYRFRMCGLPPNIAIRIIALSPTVSIAEIKKLIKREYKLNPIIDIHLILNGKMLPDYIQIEKAGINSKKDLITVLPSLIGGAVSPFKQFNFKHIRSR